MGCEEAAVTLHHELLHFEQPDIMPEPEREYDAYLRTEEWAIEHGLPEQEIGFRKEWTLADGSSVLGVDVEAIKRKVNEDYPIIAPSKPGGPIPPQVVDRTSDGKQVLVRDSNGVEFLRPVKEGDTFQARKPRNPANAKQIPPEEFKCP